MKRKVAIILVLVFLLSQFALSVSALSNPFVGYYNGFRYEGSLTGNSTSVTAKLTYADTLQSIKFAGSAHEEHTISAAYYPLSLSSAGRGTIQKTITARDGFVISSTRCSYYVNDIYTNTYHLIGTLTK